LFEKILVHPFNVELARGILPKSKFDYYSGQDSFYLSVYSKAFAILGTKLDTPEDIQFAFDTSRDCLKEKRVKDATITNRATFSYTHFLLSTSAYKSREELAAALLPCFWIYQRVAEEMKSKTNPNNPYLFWIRMYSSEKYKRETEVMIRLTDNLAAQASPELAQKMLIAFEAASRLEWEFWEEAYQHPS
jgi:thiaminase/transcriptional activator TenA